MLHWCMFTLKLMQVETVDSDIRTKRLSLSEFAKVFAEPHDLDHYGYDKLDMIGQGR